MKVRGYDPEGIEQARPLMPNVELFDDPYAAADGADAVVLVTEWDALRALDLDRIAARMAQPILVDLRNIYPPEEAEAAGLALAWRRAAGAQPSTDRRLHGLLTPCRLWRAA